jgi:hypothetical protein
MLENSQMSDRMYNLSTSGGEKRQAKVRFPHEFADRNARISEDPRGD